MSDTQASASYPHSPVTVTPGWATGQPLPIPDRQPIVRIPEQPDPVQIIRADAGPTADDLERIRVGRRRPADRSARAVQNALDAVVADKAIAAARLASRTDAAQNAFTTGAAAVQVIAARQARDIAQVELDQLTAMEAGLQLSLIRAKEAEAEEVRALVASVPAAEATVAAFRRFIEQEYPRHAAKIAAGLALESQAEDALRTLRAAYQHVSGMTAPADLPRVQNGALQETFGYRASLPGTDVRPIAKWAAPLPSVMY